MPVERAMYTHPMQALKTFGDDIAIAFSGAEDVALIEYAHLTGRPYRVFRCVVLVLLVPAHPRTYYHTQRSLDTGRLNPETYRLFDSVEKHYGIRIEYTFPDTQEVVDLVREKGMFSFYEDGHGECCRVRKVRPLRKQLTTLKAWITGQRKDQSPGMCGYARCAHHAHHAHYARRHASSSAGGAGGSCV